MALIRRRRGKNPNPDTVSVNANLKRLSIDDLYTHCETCLMLASYQLAQWRTDRVIDPSHLEQAVMQTEWALDGLRALRDRDRPGLDASRRLPGS